MSDVALFRCLHHLDDLWMNGWFPTRELNHLWIALGFYQVIENALNFFERQIEAGASIGKAERTIHVTGTIHFNDTQASMLLMIWAKAAVVRTSVLHRRGVSKWDGARFIETCCGSICLGIAIDESFKQTML